MNKKEIQFINDILKLCDELNDLLAKPYAYEPETSDIIRMAGNLAIVIKHQCDLEKENKMMSDIADMIKHHELRYKSRETNFILLQLLSALEIN